ncbi:hypothetical protein MC885_010093 [Smutsia gigantea]|nr:hypothetical protein MC885_010093 [Smutsia gigantea]
MASGVAVSDGAIKVFNDMKMCKSLTPEEGKECREAVLLRLSEDKQHIILEEGKEVLTTGPCATFVSMLPDKLFCLALCDVTYETKESKKEDLTFIFWVPQCAPRKSKMIYASSKDAIQKKLTGIKHELQANRYEEVKDHCTLAEKLGAVRSSPWEASLWELPPAPCLEHLAAPDQPPGVAGCPLPARPGGW